MERPSVDGLAVLDALPYPAFIAAGDGRVLACNPVSVSLFPNMKPDQPIAMSIRDPDVLDLIETCLREGTPGNCDYNVASGRRERIYQVNTCRIGDTTRTMVVFSDVSLVHDAGRMRTEFVANVSHELRTPITALSGMVETLRGPARDDAETRARFLDLMGREVDRMNRLVADLLSLAKAESFGSQRDHEKHNIVDIVARATDLMRPLAEECSVEINQRLGDAPAFVVGDEDMLHILHNNLIENAIKYGNSGGKIDVELEHVEKLDRLLVPGFIISVRDYGDGIEPQHLPRLTERFYRVDGHRSRSLGGTGLGLAICKHIVSRHQGHLQIESTPGEGSAFRVLLPKA